MRSTKKAAAPTWAKIGLVTSMMAFASGVMVGCAEQKSGERVITRSGGGAGSRSQRLAAQGQGQNQGPRTSRDPRSGRAVSAEAITNSIARLSQGTPILPSEITENARFQLAELTYFYEASGDQGAKVTVHQTAARHGSSAQFNQATIQITREFNGSNPLNFSSLIPAEISRVTGQDLSAWANNGVNFAVENNGRRITTLVMTRTAISNITDAGTCALTADANKTLTCTIEVNQERLQTTVNLRQVSNTQIVLEIKFQSDRQPTRSFFAVYNIVQ